MAKPRYLRKKIKTSESKQSTTLLGAPVPNNVALYVTLFCEADGITKTSIIAPLIKKWVKKAKKEFTEEKLLQLVAERGYDAWKRKPPSKRVFVPFLWELEKELRKRLPDEMVKEIVSLVKKIREDEQSKKKQPEKQSS